MTEKGLYTHEGREFFLQPISDSVVRVTHREQTWYLGLRADWDSSKPYTQTTSGDVVQKDSIGCRRSVHTCSNSEAALNDLCKTMLVQQREADARPIKEDRQGSARRVMGEFLWEIPCSTHR